MLSTCICSGCASASASAASGVCSSLDRAFFDACHAFFATDRLEGGMNARKRIDLMYLPPKSTTSMRTRSAVDAGQRLVTWQRSAPARFRRASPQSFSAFLTRVATHHAWNATAEGLCAGVEARTVQRSVVAGGPSAFLR